jgi:hypothetical protein
MSTQSTIFRDIYDMAFQISPIILTGGIASGVMGGMLPVLALMGAGFLQGALTSGGISMQDFPVRFLPIPGGTIINNSVGMYPFANQQVAANAIIEQPLNISLHMIAPVQDLAGYATKLAYFTGLQASFRSHNNSGGLYTVATPAMLYTDLIMVGMSDITGGDTNQKQIEWQIDFVKPLVSLAAANVALGGMMSRITGGGVVQSSSWASQAMNGVNNGVAAIGGAATSLAGAVGSVL